MVAPGKISSRLTHRSAFVCTLLSPPRCRANRRGNSKIVPRGVLTCVLCLVHTAVVIVDMMRMGWRQPTSAFSFSASVPSLTKQQEANAWQCSSMLYESGALKFCPSLTPASHDVVKNWLSPWIRTISGIIRTAVCTVKLPARAAQARRGGVSARPKGRPSPTVGCVLCAVCCAGRRVFLCTERPPRYTINQTESHLIAALCMPPVYHARGSHRTTTYNAYQVSVYSCMYWHVCM